jgi:Leucine-rich repeat (LRR) protein
MSVNKLEGEIPKSLGNATNLVYIFLAQNSFSGVIPSLGTLPNLWRLVLFENRKLEAGDWTFLSSLRNCTQLDILILEGNNLQGNLPNSVANLSGIFDLVGLSILYLDNNMLTGPIPDSIGNLRNLFALNLMKNGFYGNIPTSIGNLEILSELYLQENRLSGVIPAELARCEKLVALNLSSNTLSGPIPQGLFGKLNELNWFLDFSNNQLTHSIPDWQHDQSTILQHIQQQHFRQNPIDSRLLCALARTSPRKGTALRGKFHHLLRP